MLSKALVNILFALMRLAAKLPYNMLYKISDVIAFLLNHVFRYRKAVIHKNITASFPEKSKQDIQSIADKFYKHLADRIIESVICTGISKSDLLERVKVVNYNLVEDLCAEGKNVVAVLGHCGSWEMACLASSIYIDEYLKYAIYTPSRNIHFDNALKETRGRFGMQLISMQQAPYFLRKGFGHTSVGMFLADQSHSNPARAYWTPFLNRETAFMNGAARFARAHNAAYIFVKVTEKTRGYFDIENILIEKDSNRFTENELTEKFVRLLENQIISEPSDWLWSHKRWKHIKKGSSVAGEA